MLGFVLGDCAFDRVFSHLRSGPDSSERSAESSSFTVDRNYANGLKAVEPKTPAIQYETNNKFVCGPPYAATSNALNSICANAKADGPARKP